MLQRHKSMTKRLSNSPSGSFIGFSNTDSDDSDMSDVELGLNLSLQISVGLLVTALQLLFIQPAILIIGVKYSTTSLIRTSWGNLLKLMKIWTQTK